MSDDGLTEAEQKEMDELSGNLLPVGYDSIRVFPNREMDHGVLRKRLYVASGSGGLFCLEPR